MRYGAGLLVWAIAVCLAPARADSVDPSSSPALGAGEFGFGAPVAEATLDSQRAGEGRTQLNLMDVQGYVEDNKAINNITGSNVITGGSFTNVSGLPVSVQNSGNNVLIQNAFILNLEVK
jgi:hypothetical protein